MAERTPIETKNLDIYGNPVIPWSEVRDALSERHGPEIAFFLGTTRPDGRLHAAGVGPVWLDGDIYITTGLGTQKAKNLAAHPGCTLSGHMPGFDVVLEGAATLVNDPETLEKAAALYRDGGWPAVVEGDALTAPYSAPSAGPPPWHLFRLVFDAVVALKLDDKGGATRWTFSR